MMQNQILSRNPLTFGEQISKELGAEFINQFRDECPNEPESFLVGKSILERIFAQPGCVGIRFYNAINEFGDKTLVYVGIDANEQTLLEISEVNQLGQISSRPAIVGDRCPRPMDVDTLETWVTPENF